MSSSLPHGNSDLEGAQALAFELTVLSDSAAAALPAKTSWPQGTWPQRSRSFRAMADTAQMVVADSKNTITLARSSADVSPPYGFAVLRLITNSNFVGSITGRSPGLSPLRMRPA